MGRALELCERGSLFTSSGVWQSWAAKQLSVAVQQAVAEEIAHALGIATA